MKERQEPFENDRVLENGLSFRNPEIFSRSGPHGAKGGHREEVGLGLAELRLIHVVSFIIFFKRNIYINTKPSIYIYIYIYINYLSWPPVGHGLWSL